MLLREQEEPAFISWSPPSSHRLSPSASPSKGTLAERRLGSFRHWSDGFIFLDRPRSGITLSEAPLCCAI